MLDEIEAELAAVAGEAKDAQRALAGGDLDETLAAVVLAHDVLFAKTPARGYALRVFSAARHPDCSERLQSLQASLDSVGLRLREAGRACGERDAALVHEALAEAAQAAVIARAVVSQLLEGPLGQQIRRLHLDGYLDG